MRASSEPAGARYLGSSHPFGRSRHQGRVRFDPLRTSVTWSTVRGMTKLFRALLLVVVAFSAAVILGYSLGIWKLELSLWAFYLPVAVVLLALCASIWSACARWTRMPAASRIGLALVFPLVCFWAWLRWDGALFNDVVFALFLFPLLVFEGGLLVVLERVRSHQAA